MRQQKPYAAPDLAAGGPPCPNQHGPPTQPSLPQIPRGPAPGNGYRPAASVTGPPRRCVTSCNRYRNGMSSPRDRIEARLGLTGPPLQKVRDAPPQIPDHEL